MMLRKTAIAFFALMALSACSTSAKNKACVVATNEAGCSVEDFSKNSCDRVHFAFAKSDLTDQAKGVLQSQAAWLCKNGCYKVTVEGHCDDRGTREYNMALGARRANAARDFLLASGVDASKVDTISYGKDKPVVEGHTKEARAQNRVAISVLSKTN